MPKNHKCCRYSLWTVLLVSVLSSLGCSHSPAKSNLASADLEDSPEWIEKALSLYIEDGRELEKYEIFNTKSGGQSDAGPFLNRKFAWAFDEKLPKSGLSIPGNLADELRKQKDWTKWSPDWKKLNLDFGWMRKIREFDYWNIDENNPHLGRESRSAFLLPGSGIYSDLPMWARLRLLKSKEDADFESAFEDVQHLASLIMTLEESTAMMTALNVLGALRGFADSIGAKRDRIPDVVFSRARRFFFTPSSLADPAINVNTWHQAMSLKAGRCSRVFEVIRESLFIRAYFDDAAEYLKRVDDIVQQTSAECRRSIFRKLWNDPKYSYFQDEEKFVLSQGNSTPVGAYNSSEEAKRARELARSTSERRRAYGKTMILLKSKFLSYRRELKQ